MDRVLYLLFFLSGATGLVYEVIWVRLTGLTFGNTSYSISTVIGAFMAGLALGSWQLGRRVDSVERPLRMYGMLEMLIGVFAAAVPSAFSLLDTFYWAAAPSLSAIPGADLFAKFIASFVIMLVPTFLMGGTLPVLARYFVTRSDEVERRVAALYALNTFGAAAGTLLAALVLIPELGTTRTTLLIAAVNMSIGLLATRLDRAQAALPAAAEPAGESLPEPALSEAGSIAAEGPVEERPTAATADRLVLAAVAVSGLVAMVYEVSWTRALAAMIGSSTYAFSIMLVTFLVGIALGSWFIEKRRPRASMQLLGLLQLGIAFGGLIFLMGYLAAPYILTGLIRAFFYSFPAVLTSQFLLCSCLMILPTLFMGATFPVAGQLYSSRIRILGRQIGSVYSINTLGAILGSLATGFFLVPVIGTERAILVGLFANSALALYLLAEDKDRPWVQLKWVSLALLLVATVSMRGGLFWKPDMLDRGILIYSRQFDARPEMTVDEHYQDTDVVFFAEGRNATISIRAGENYVGLRTNGKVDASTGDDMQTQLLTGWVPGFYHPNPKEALVIGYGSGVTVGAVASIPEIEHIDVAEIEEGVVRAGAWFAHVNRRSFEDPKVRFIYDDARNYMNITRKTYDIIISEPSNPWIAGVGNLFTAEFYERVTRSLNQGGIFGQWIQLYEMAPEDLRMIFAEFQRQFPEVSVWVPGSGDLLLVGTKEPQVLDMERVSRIAGGDPSIRKDLETYFHLRDAQGVLAYYVFGAEQARQFGQTDLRNTDDHPVLEFHAPRQLFKETRDLNVELLYELKPGLIPEGAVVQDTERVMYAMVPALIGEDRQNLANQAMGILSQTERRNESSLHLTMARLHLDTNAYENARSALRKAEEIGGARDPLFAEREQLWGSLLEETGAHAEAVERYRRAVAADPTQTESLLKLAELTGRLEQWEEAAGWMERYIATKPRGVARYWAILGDYLFASRKVQEAVKALETAIKQDPYSYWARFRLATLLQEQKDTDGAITQLQFLAKYAFDRNEEIYTRLAELYRAAGRNGDALNVLAKGARIFPTNTKIHKLRRDIELGIGAE